jgi:hypothetical protein
MKVVIAGSRTFNDFDFLVATMFRLFPKKDIITEIVSGAAKGADQLGEKWAKMVGIPIKQFPAEWNKYGKSAGYRRNAEMALYCDSVVAFWDGKSKGTKHMIDIAKDNGLAVAIVMDWVKKED